MRRGEIKDITGKQFGRLIVLCYAGRSNKSRNSTWKCQCACGKIKIINGANLVNGHTKSCGCLSVDITSIRARIHGHSKTKLYFVWRGILNRCLNKSVHNYARYGGRGIKICEEWKNPSEFFKWALANGYKEGLQIERKNNNGNYEPSNCCWITSKEQSKNTSRNVFFEINGSKRILSDWARSVGLSISCVRSRLKKGWDISTALIVPPMEPAEAAKLGRAVRYGQKKIS